jgi:UDPglucose 6-dehydrogenase
MKQKKIGFIGVGKLGQDCAEAIADKGHFVEGYDVSPRTPRNFGMRDSIRELVEGKDIIFIAAPTPHDPMYGGELPTAHLIPKDFDYTIVKNILTEVNKHINKNQLLVLISTVLPGTTRSQFVDLVKNSRFIYNPYLIAMGSVAWDMVNPEMVIIGTEDGTTTGDAKELIEFYNSIMENDPRFEVGTWDEAEAIKIFYNTFISAKIGLVNMVQDVAEKLGNINVDVVTGALARSTQRIMGPKYMIAGGPDAGACHPRDNIALRWMAEELDLQYDLFGSIMHAREIQTRNLAMRVLKESNGLPIVIVGKAYKPGVTYLEGSGSLLVEHYLRAEQTMCYFLDKYTNDMPPGSITSGPCVYLLMHDSEITYCDSPMKDTVTKQEIRPVGGSVIIDIWRKQQPVAGCKVIHYGNTRTS